MNKIEKFDSTLKEYDSYQFLMYKVLRYILGILGCFLMIIPIQETLEDGILIEIMVLFLLVMSSILRLQPYMMIKENGKQSSIYKKLEWMPISKIDILKVRIQYLYKYCIKIEIIIMVLQQLGAIANKYWGIENLLYPIAVVVIMFLVGTLYIRFE